MLISIFEEIQASIIVLYSLELIYDAPYMQVDGPLSPLKLTSLTLGLLSSKVGGDTDSYQGLHRESAG